MAGIPWPQQIGDQLGVEPKIGGNVSPQIIHLNDGFFHYKPSILGFFPLFFGNTQLLDFGRASWRLRKHQSETATQGKVET